LKKLLLFFLIAASTPLYSFAIEEVELEIPEKKLDLDYFSDVYYGRIENDEDVSPILKLFSEKGLEFKNSKINSLKATFVYDGQLIYGKEGGQSPYLNHDFSTVEPMLTLKFNDNKSKIMFDYNLTRNLEGYTNRFTEKISQIYISHEITPNQTILIGQGRRLPNSYDGCRSTMERELVLKSQIGRTFGDARSVGIRNIASYKFVDYDIGVYDSTRYMKDFGNGVDFTGYIMIKPFEAISEHAGDLKLGGGYQTGKNYISYNVYSLFAGYDYKRFHIHAEYANADGYNGIHQSSNKADGFYTIASFDITPKLSILGRYDYFTGNRSSSNSYSQEYTAGVTYKMFKNMKFMLNYVNKNHSDRPNSNMILFATRFII